MLLGLRIAHPCLAQRESPQPRGSGGGDAGKRLLTFGYCILAGHGPRQPGVCSVVYHRRIEDDDRMHPRECRTLHWGSAHISACRTWPRMLVTYVVGLQAEGQSEAGTSLAWHASLPCIFPLGSQGVEIVSEVSPSSSGPRSSHRNPLARWHWGFKTRPSRPFPNIAGREKKLT